MATCNSDHQRLAVGVRDGSIFPLASECRKNRNVPRTLGSPNWRVQVDAPRPAREQMSRDAALAAEAVPTLRLFRWDPPAMSLGWKQPYPEWYVESRWHDAGLELVERPTGGGIAFHGSDVSVSVIVPRGLQLSLEHLMSTVCQVTVRFCRTYGVEATPSLDEKSEGRITYCLTQPSPYAVFIESRKVAGFALRRFPETWLIQGSVFVRPLPPALTRVLPWEVQHQLALRAVALSEVAGMPVNEDGLAQRWAKHWATWWEEMISPIWKSDFADSISVESVVRKSAESF